VHGCGSIEAAGGAEVDTVDEPIEDDDDEDVSDVARVVDELERSRVEDVVEESVVEMVTVFELSEAIEELLLLAGTSIELEYVDSDEILVTLEIEELPPAVKVVCVELMDVPDEGDVAVNDKELSVFEDELIEADVDELVSAEELCSIELDEVVADGKDVVEDTSVLAEKLSLAEDVDWAELDDSVTDISGYEDEIPVAEGIEDMERRDAGFVVYVNERELDE
jgi:hypothetical protein